MNKTYNLHITTALKRYIRLFAYTRIKPNIHTYIHTHTHRHTQTAHTHTHTHTCFHDREPSNLSRLVFKPDGYVHVSYCTVTASRKRHTDILSQA